MSTVFQENSTRSEAEALEMYCSSCWRDEYHRPQQRNENLILLFTILTFGLYNFFRTFRCCTCGKLRVFASLLKRQ